MKVVAGAVVLLLVLAFGAWKQQEAPLEVTCGTVTGGKTATAKGVDVARKLGDWLHRVAEHPEEYQDKQAILRTVNGVMHDVLWYWLRAAFLSARGEKIDPQILKLQQDADKAASAANDACTPCPTADDDSGSDTPDPRARLTSQQSVGAWSKENADIAKTAIAVGKSMGVPSRGWVVIIAAGWQESGMRNLTYGDRDSLGWLQQRASWGSVEQRMNPAYQARKFFAALKRVKGWQDMPVTVAAQRVQISAYPDAYAKWELRAREMVRQFGDEPARPDPSTPRSDDVQCVTPDQEAGGTNIATVAGYRKLREPTSGVTYQVPVPKGPRGVAVNFALDQVEQGDWYRFGAHGPDLWDCSGLVAGAWGKAGYRLIPQTEAMLRTIPRVAKPQGGDLLYKYGHVQMYLGRVGGETLIVEAPRTGSRLRVRPQWMTVTAILDPTRMGQRA